MKLNKPLFQRYNWTYPAERRTIIHCIDTKKDIFCVLNFCLGKKYMLFSAHPFYHVRGTGI